MNCVIYGANGYTGELTARYAVKRGLKPVLAGRSKEPVEALASELGLPSAVVSLDDSAALDELLKDKDVVIHCAGPFSRTSRPMVKACLRTGTHYLDITGEMAVFRSVFKKDEEAREAGVILMPGVGFDVVPTDCMAALLHEQLPEATHLEMAFGGLGSISRGTLKTSIEGMSMGNWIRRDGKLVGVPSGELTRTIPFPRKPLHGMSIPWGDVVTAYRTTKIPNITVYTAIPPKTVAWIRRTRRFQGLTALKGVQWLLKRWVDSREPGPNEELRTNGYSDIWGKAMDADGNWVEGNFTTPEGYTLTAMSAVQVVLELDKVKPGAWTPAAALGHELVTRIEGVTEPVLSRGTDQE